MALPALESPLGSQGSVLDIYFQIGLFGIPVIVLTRLISMHGQLPLGHVKTYTAGTELSEAGGRQLRTMATTGLSEKCSKRTLLSVGT